MFFTKVLYIDYGGFPKYNLGKLKDVRKFMAYPHNNIAFVSKFTSLYSLVLFARLGVVLMRIIPYQYNDDGKGEGKGRYVRRQYLFD